MGQEAITTSQAISVYPQRIFSFSIAQNQSGEQEKIISDVMALCRKGNYGAARQQVIRLLNHDTRNVVWWLLLSRVNIYFDRFDQAVHEAFPAIERLSPDHPELLYYRAKVNNQRGNISASISLYRQALSQMAKSTHQPLSDSALHKHVMVNLGAAYFTNGEIENAIAITKPVNQSAVARHNLGIYYLARNSSASWVNDWQIGRDLLKQVDPIEVFEESAQANYRSACILKEGKAILNALSRFQEGKSERFTLSQITSFFKNRPRTNIPNELSLLFTVGFHYVPSNVTTSLNELPPVEKILHDRQGACDGATNLFHQVLKHVGIPHRLYRYQFAPSRYHYVIAVQRETGRWDLLDVSGFKAFGKKSADELLYSIPIPARDSIFTEIVQSADGRLSPKRTFRLPTNN